MNTPEDIQLVGDTLAIRWSCGAEDYLNVELLRAMSPSAENQGEADLFGRVRGGDPRTKYPGVTLTGWQPVGRYALRLTFSDGHDTGLYSFDYLRQLGAAQRQVEEEGGGTPGA